MNGNSLTRSLAALSLPLLFFLSCNKTDQESHSASGITFVGVSSAEEQTKTSYSGEGTTSGGLLVKERLDWETGDYITIVSDSAFVINKSVTPWTLVYNQTGYSSCDYQITSAAPYGNSDPSKALISRAKVVPAGSGENGLQWGAGTHTFYAMYPASAGTPGFTNAERNKVGITPTEMKGTIPQAQSPKWTGNVGKPQMQYAYMWGTATAEANATSVNLPFYPQFSAFEFQVGLGQNDEVKITSFTFESTSASAAVTGDFTLSNASGRNGAVSTSNTSNKISVSLNKTLKPTQADSTITFTVLALPTSKGHMRMTFTGPEIGTRTVILKKNGTEISFNDPRKKYRITGIHFPKNGLGADGEEILWDQEAFGEDIWWEEVIE